MQLKNYSHLLSLIVFILSLSTHIRAAPYFLLKADSQPPNRFHVWESIVTAIYGPNSLLRNEAYQPEISAIKKKVPGAAGPWGTTKKKF